MGALLIARRKKDEKVQKAARNVRWFFTTGFGALIAWRLVTWATGFMDRQQAAAEVRDAALVTALAEVTAQLETLGGQTGDLSLQITSMRSLAIGAKKLPDCPACVCSPKVPACPTVIVTTPSGLERRAPGREIAPSSPPSPPPVQSQGRPLDRSDRGP